MNRPRNGDLAALEVKPILTNSRNKRKWAYKDIQNLVVLLIQWNYFEFYLSVCLLLF